MASLSVAIACEHSKPAESDYKRKRSAQSCLFWSLSKLGEKALLAHYRGSYAVVFSTDCENAAVCSTFLHLGSILEVNFAAKSTK
ncbi:hypothetical protein ACM41_13265 [Bradyrhizobium sp. CCBAU 21362]|nr:hypothetical protein [Bradyrhizobium sp. CCBAU 21362]